MTIASKDRTCVGCKCTDSRACPRGCYWLMVDDRTRTGVCSKCTRELKTFKKNHPEAHPDLLRRYR